jgi:PAS domain-containing protein
MGSLFFMAVNSPVYRRTGSDWRLPRKRSIFSRTAKPPSAHEKAHQARQWLESVLAPVAEAVIVTDALGFVRYANPAAEAMFGWSAQELIGRVIEKNPSALLLLDRQMGTELSNGAPRSQHGNRHGAHTRPIGIAGERQRLAHHRPG